MTHQNTRTLHFLCEPTHQRRQSTCVKRHQRCVAALMCVDCKYGRRCCVKTLNTDTFEFGFLSWMKTRVKATFTLRSLFLTFMFRPDGRNLATTKTSGWIQQNRQEKQNGSSCLIWISSLTLHGFSAGAKWEVQGSSKLQQFILRLDVNVGGKFQRNPSSSCQDISLKTTNLMVAPIQLMHAEIFLSYRTFHWSSVFWSVCLL